ncbi:Putative vacuolar protein sorting protein 36, GLUE [Septoria linicola]|uniref:Vacuolar protein-sorting-associated protein 36 n=1 Tax=Septoria linicola TaxID=215465 RepID=A0A9Q9AZ44_9PEZI|nr:putative vacuolar protein sorting protein 36, GLUE [Septoria linicola]USW54522.1 Putative vacuolar protein sorting protein 36, GLUE [Septoria linicola]
MFLRHLDLTTALRPSLYDDESLLFVQDGVGLYEGKYKIPNHQNGHAYLTSHRVCYVDNEEPRKYSVAVDLKEIERPEFYAGFLKSSAKITLFPKTPKKTALNGIRSPVPRYASPSDALVRQTGPPSRSVPSPVPARARDVNATWICPICSIVNPVPSNFDPGTANQYTPLPACQTCGVKPPLALMIKASIAAMSNRPSGAAGSGSGTPRASLEVNSASPYASAPPSPSPASNICPRCTYHNFPGMTSCEVCSASLQAPFNHTSRLIEEVFKRPESPGPSLPVPSIVDDQTIETIKFSFRAGGEKVFLERLQEALVQRKWLLQSAPPVPRPGATPPQSGGLFNPPGASPAPTSTPPRVVGIAGLEQRGAALRQNNQAVIGTAFEDLEALMTSAKEVIQMAEQFARQANGSASDDAKKIISDSASALGLVTTKDMLGTGSSAEQLYVTELARDLAEFLTDDRKGVLRKEGGIMSLVDLWQVFNRTRNGIELISPLDFEKAANMWDQLNMPVRLRRFKSGLLVVQERSRTDAKTIATLLGWLREPQHGVAAITADSAIHAFGKGITAQEAAERFGWSIGVATEELEMAEETGAVCRDQCLDGIRFWENHFSAMAA